MTSVTCSSGLITLGLRSSSAAAASGGVLAQLSRTDAGIFQRAMQYGASAANSFANNLSALARAVKDVDPSFQVHKIGQIGNSPVWGSIPSKVGIAEVNGVTVVVKMVGDKPQVLGTLP